MNPKIKERQVCIKLTSEALRILAEVSKEMGISRTAAIELAVRKAYVKDKPCGK